jgi:hypothetical protein
MEQTANSSLENKRYNDEAVLLDGLYEFHPDLFNELGPHELHVLETYYLTGQDVPDNVFEYRAQLVKNRPEIEEEAHAAFSKVCKLAGSE